VQNDDGEYVVLDALASRTATPEEMQECLSWYKMVAAGKTKLDDSDLTEETVTEKVVSTVSEKF
jgi:hypothetical protein